MGDGASSSSRRRGGGDTVLIDHGQLKSTCGYCRSISHTSISHGLWAQSIKADDYQVNETKLLLLMVCVQVWHIVEKTKDQLGININKTLPSSSYDYIHAWPRFLSSSTSCAIRTRDGFPNEDERGIHVKLFGRGVVHLGVIRRLVWCNKNIAMRRPILDLLDRGWRRSGCFLYKPEMESTCCPPYTIRLKACDFVPSKEQIRVQKKIQRFLEGTLNPKKADQIEKMDTTEHYINSCKDESLASSSSGTSLGNCLSCKNKKFNEEELLQVLSNGINNAISACIERGEFPSSIQLPKAVVKKVKLNEKRKLAENLMYTSSISFQIAALLRRGQSLERNDYPACLKTLDQNGRVLDIPPNSISEMLLTLMNLDRRPFGILAKACNGHLNFYSCTDQAADCSDLVSNKEELAQTVEVSRGKNKESCSTDSSVDIPFKKHKFEIRLKSSSFDFEEFALYKRYQINVHGDLPDKVTESSYCKFLVDTPIIYVPPSSGARSVPRCGYGSFHQQYVIDGKVVAVGVIDILPRCLSSKYLFWDPDFSFLSLGKYSALQEINWVKDSHDYCESLQYYYLGYYIHSCSKMRYKAAYRPSELLCPLRYVWVQFDIAKPLLDKNPYAVLSDFVTKQYNPSSNGASWFSDCNVQNIAEDGVAGDHRVIDENENFKSDAENSSEPFRNKLKAFNVNNILIELHGSRLSFKSIRQLFGSIDKRFIRDLEMHLESYVRVVGSELSARIIYSLG